MACMIGRKFIIVSFIVILSATPSLSSNCVSPPSPSNNWDSRSQESHLINGVKYVAQNERNFCVYACLTMIFNYMDLNTTLDELLFYGGVGYTHSYSEGTRLPNSDIWNRFEFLYYVYGVTEHSWIPPVQNLSSDALWEQYYERLKENITNDTPVVTRVDPFSLPSLRNQFKTNDFVWKIMFPPGFHVIVVVGYNETNQSICYQDPNAGFYGNDSFGTYAWIPMSEFRQAHEKINDYVIITYTQSDTPLSKQEAFDEAFRKNIENLTGGSQAHGRYYGINASQKMHLDFSLGTNQSQETSAIYKEYCGTGMNYTLDMIMQRLCSFVDPLHPNIFDIIMAGKEDPFEDIAAGKDHAAEYLEQCVIHPALCKNQSSLLRSEAEKWHDVSTYYKIFLRKGMFLSDGRAAHAMSRMETLMNDIIGIEETLITQT